MVGSIKRALAVHSRDKGGEQKKGEGKHGEIKQEKNK